MPSDYKLLGYVLNSGRHNPLKPVHTLLSIRSQPNRSLCLRHTAVLNLLVFISLTTSCSLVYSAPLIVRPLSSLASAKPQKTSGFNKNDAGSTGNLKVTNSNIYAVQPDPKRPGKFMWKIWASGFTLLNPGNQITVTVQDVSALLFQAGQAAATLRAPLATYDNIKHTIVASGGVLVRSISEPGTTLRADNVVFYAATGKLKATGHVVYHNGKTLMELHTNELDGDTKLKTLSSNTGGSVALPKGL